MVLLEVTIALVVFTLVAFSLIVVLNTSMKLAIERNEIDASTRGLENQVALLHLARIVPIDKDLPADGSGVTYHLVIAPEQLQNKKSQQVSGIYRATVSAKWTSNGQQENRSISELLYQP